VAVALLGGVLPLLDLLVDLAWMLLLLLLLHALVFFSDLVVEALLVSAQLLVLIQQSPLQFVVGLGIMGHGVDASCQLLLLHAPYILLHNGVAHSLQLLRIAYLLVSVGFKGFVLAAFVTFVHWLSSLGSLLTHFDVSRPLIRSLIVHHLLIILRIILVHFVDSGPKAVCFDLLDALGARPSAS